MKAIKKFAAILASTTMLAALAVPTAVSAAPEDIVITINNAKEGHTYNAYKIFDLSYGGDNGTPDDPSDDSYSYSINTGSAWYDYVVDSGYFTLTDSDTENVKYVKANSDFTAAATFAKGALAYATEDNDVAEVTVGDGETTAALVVGSYGYYLVDTTVGSACILTTADPTAAIGEKNDVPTIDKTVSNAAAGTFGDSSTAAIGDTVYFQIVIDVKDGAQNYKLYDYMEAGLDLNEDSFLLDGAALGTNAALNAADNSFTIEFADAYLEGKDTIIVTYTATLGTDAEISTATNDNTAYLTYGDAYDYDSDDDGIPDEADPDDDNDGTPDETDDDDDNDGTPDGEEPEDPGKTPEDKTKTLTYQITIEKHANSADGALLSGATFELYEGTTLVNLVKVSANVYRPAVTGDTTTVESITTDGTGKFVIQGLDVGAYELKETVAPNGYNLPSENFKVTIDNANADEDIVNNSGTVLPETGATGTIIFTLIGAALIGITGVLMITRKKMSVYEG